MDGLKAEVEDLKQQHPVPATTTVWVHGSAARIEGANAPFVLINSGDPDVLQIAGQHQATYKVTIPAPPAWRAAVALTRVFLTGICGGTFLCSGRLLDGTEPIDGAVHAQPERGFNHPRANQHDHPRRTPSDGRRPVP